MVRRFILQHKLRLFGKKAIIGFRQCSQIIELQCTAQVPDHCNNVVK